MNTNTKGKGEWKIEYARAVGHTMQPNIHLIGTPEGQKKENKAEQNLKNLKLMAQIFQKLWKISNHRFKKSIDLKYKKY